MKSRAWRALLITAWCLLLAAGCDQAVVTPSSGANEGTLEVHSGAFANGAPIPVEYTCDGRGQTLPVAWSAVDGAAEFALVMDDPDANGFVHWVVVNIPSDVHALADPLPSGAIAATNGRGQTGYTGPCPPSGTHTYRVTVYALNVPLGLDSATTADEVRSAAAGKTIATGTLTGTYGREPATTS